MANETYKGLMERFARNETSDIKRGDKAFTKQHQSICWYFEDFGHPPEAFPNSRLE